MKQNRIFSLILAFLLLFSIAIPTVVFASDLEDENVEITETTPVLNEEPVEEETQNSNEDVQIAETAPALNEVQAEEENLNSDEGEEITETAPVLNEEPVEEETQNSNEDVQITETTPVLDEEPVEEETQNSNEDEEITETAPALNEVQAEEDYQNSDEVEEPSEEQYANEGKQNSLSVPVITKEPDDVSGAVNEIVTFSVEATDAESFKWQYSTDNGITWDDCSTKIYTGALTDTIKVKVTAARNGWQYRCVVTGGGKTVESQGATLTVAAEAAKITKNPDDASGAVNEMVTFSVVAENAETYKWQYSTDNGSSWSDCSTKIYTGALTDTITVKVTAARDGWQYRCVVTGGGKTIESEGATLTVDKTFAINDVIYETLTESTCAVKAYSGDKTTLVIPELADGKTVTEIGVEAFMNNTTLVSIDLPDTITVIRARAFKGCTNLSSMS